MCVPKEGTKLKRSAKKNSNLKVIILLLKSILKQQEATKQLLWGQISLTLSARSPVKGNMISESQSARGKPQWNQWHRSKQALKNFPSPLSSVSFCPLIWLDPPATSHYNPSPTLAMREHTHILQWKCCRITTNHTGQPKKASIDFLCCKLIQIISVV